MKIADYQIAASLLLMLADILFRFYKLRNVSMPWHDKLFYKKFNMLSRLGFFALPGWVWGGIVFFVIYGQYYF